MPADIAKGFLNDIGGSTIAAFDNIGNVFGVACSETQTIFLFGTNTGDSVSPVDMMILLADSQ
jgi:hypothetical protein